MGNWLDDAIGYFAPAAALKRERARAARSLMKRAYDGAALGRNTGGWNTPSTSSDAELYAALPRLRNRSRDLVRNNAHAAKAVTVLANNIIGDGIVPRPKTGSEAKDKKVKAAFDAWVDECDADGQLDFYGLQTLAVREMIEAGEVLARRRRRFASDGLAVPMQIQLLEADFLDGARNGENTPLGNTIIQGIEFDRLGRRQAYWLWSSHPGNNYVDMRQSLVSNAVPAEDVAHVYEKQRTQVRGCPWSAPIMRTLRDLDDYEMAELVRKKMEACLLGVVVGGDLDDSGQTEGMGGGVVDADGNLIERFEPGMLAYARGGSDIRFNSPAVVAGYAEYKQVRLREVSAGYRMPYELLTGDLGEVNFSSMRGGIVEFRRFITSIQWHVVVPMLLEPQWKWFCEAAYLAGKIDDPVVPVRWSPPKMPWVDPSADADAELKAIRAGTRTWEEVVAERGGDPDEVFGDIVRWQQRCAENGVVLDSNPAQVSGRGVAQKDGSKSSSDGDGAQKPKRAKRRALPQPKQVA